MQRYPKFMCDVVAVTHEMNRLSWDASNGFVPVDARLLNELVRLVSKARANFNAHMEFTTAQGIQRLNTRFNLDEKKADKPKEKEKDADEEIQQEGQTDAA